MSPKLAQAFASTPDLQVAVQAALDATYESTTAPERPTVEMVVAEAIGMVVFDALDRAHDIASCTKVDDCAARAVVLRKLADWLTQ